MPYFYDKDDNEYTAELLSEGGQGKVYLTNDKKLAIKVSTKDEDREAYLKRLNGILSVFADDSVHVAFPLIALRDECGYVMEFLEGGTDIGGMLITSGKMSVILDKYNKTGGLKRRLLLLADLAKTLHGLHKYGWVYGDISDKNVFVSDLPYSQIYEQGGNIDVNYAISESNTRISLIDADNIKQQRECKSAIYTPGFGAPEVAMNLRANSFNSDMYSFALLAYRLLNINGPFDGYEEDDEDWDCWDDDTVTGEGAFLSAGERGDAAFIFDENNPSGGKTAGIIHYSFGCSEKLISLFRKTFSYESRKLLLPRRPSAMSWACALYEATDSLVYCPKCKAHHYYKTMPCGAVFKGVLAHIDYLTYVDGDYAVTDAGEVVSDGDLTSVYDRKTQRTDLKARRIFDLRKVENNKFTIENPDKEYGYKVFRKGTAVDGNYDFKTCEIWVFKAGAEEYFARLHFEVK